MRLDLRGWAGGCIRKMYLEQEGKSQYRAEGMGNFFLDGKKQSLLLRNRGEWRLSPGVPPQALTGPPLAGLSPSLLIPAPQPTLAALEGVSRPCSSSPPREPAGPDMLIAPCPGPCPARLLCLSWSVPAAGLGASWASHTLLSASCSV